MFIRGWKLLLSQMGEREVIIPCKTFPVLVGVIGQSGRRQRERRKSGRGWEKTKEEIDMNACSCSRNNGKIISDPPSFCGFIWPRRLLYQVKVKSKFILHSHFLELKKVKTFIYYKLSLRVGICSKFVLVIFPAIALLLRTLLDNSRAIRKHITSSLKCWPTCYTHTHTQLVHLSTKRGKVLTNYMLCLNILRRRLWMHQVNSSVMSWLLSPQRHVKVLTTSTCAYDLLWK